MWRNCRIILGLPLQLPALAWTLPLCALLLLGSNAFAVNQAQRDATHKRAEALQTLLKLSSAQTDSIEALLIQTFERGEQHRELFDDDYYALALENQKEMDSMRAHVDATLTDEQREKYHTIQKTAPVRYSSRDGEALAKRLLLDSSQARIVDAILSYVEQDLNRIRQEVMRKSGGFSGGFGFGNDRVPKLRRSKLLKAHEAIEKVLTKAQKKKFKEFKREQMEEFRPSGDDDHRRRRNGGL